MKNYMTTQNVLNAHLFETLDDVRLISEEWMDHYNREKPHESLEDLTPQEYLLKYGQLDKQISKDELSTFQQIDDDDLKEKRFL